MKKILSVILAIFMLVSMGALSFAASPSGDEIISLSEDGYFLHLENIEDLSAVDISHPDLKEIYLDNCLVKGNEEIFYNPKIERLSLWSCKFENGELNIHRDLKELVLGEIEEAPLLKASGKVKKIQVYDSVIKNLTSFSDIGKIECLSFDNCQIGSISGVEVGNEIEELSFYNVPIESIEEIGRVKGLRSLDLSSTAVRDLTPLKNLDLYFLAVHDCLMIENLEIIMEIETLNELGSSNCQMLYTPEIVAYLKKNDISSHYEEGDLELREKLLEKCREIEKKYLTVEERIGAAVQLACDMIVYDYEVYSNDNLTIKYGNNILKYAFKGTGCCSTYAGLVAMMLNEMGIDCYLVSGDDHVWNLVELDGYSYWLDATWIDTGWYDFLDDSPYYMTTDEEFLDSHSDFLTPYRILNNPHSFDGAFECKTRFRIQAEYLPEEENDVTPTLPEITTMMETTKAEVTHVEKTTDEEVTEKVTEEKTTENKEKNKRPVLIISLSVAGFIVVAAAVVLVVKKRNKVNS